MTIKVKYPENYFDYEGNEFRYCKTCMEFHPIEAFDKMTQPKTNKTYGIKRYCNKEYLYPDVNKEKRESMPTELSPLTQMNMDDAWHRNDVIVSEKVLENIGFELYNPERPIYEQFLERVRVKYGVSLRA